MSYKLSVGLHFLFSLIVLSVAIYLYKSNKVYYISTSKVVSKYKRTDYYNVAYQKLVNKNKYYLDSLGAVISSLEKSSSSDSELLVKQKRNLYLLSERFLKEENKYRSEMEQKVVQEINLLAKEYGASRRISILLGASGNGNIVYADSELDLTDDFIRYINEE